MEGFPLALALGIWKKDIKWPNKPFVPIRATGFFLMLVSFVPGQTYLLPGILFCR